MKFRLEIAALVLASAASFATARMAAQLQTVQQQIDTTANAMSNQKISTNNVNQVTAKPEIQSKPQTQTTGLNNGYTPIPDVNPSPEIIYKTTLLDADFEKLTAKYSSNQSPLSIALKFAQENLNLQKESYALKKIYQDTSPKLSHIYLRQLMHGIEIQSSNMEFHLDDKGQIINYAHSFYSGPAVAKPAVWSPDDPKMIASMRAALQELSNHIKQKLPNINAVKITPQKTSNENDVKYIIENVPFALDPIQVKRAFIHSKNKQLTLAWEFTIKLKIDYINAHVAVDRPRVVALANWTSRYQYNVVPLGKIRIYESGQTVLTDPQKLFDPKNDWHIGTRKYNALWGNNIQIENDGVTGYVKSKNDIYNYNGYGPASISAKAAATNAFYIFNMMHDIFREYGFNEIAGNFQKLNFDKGGYGNDPVQAYLRYPESINNAFFATPPDGQSGILKTGMWTGSYPNLDSGFQSQLMVHEVTHGTSNRLIGGSHNSNCLTNMEGKAMGEGWSDFVALWVEMTEKSQPTDRMDVNKLDNIYSGRPYPYSLSKQDNPARYGNLLESKWQQEHAGGSIWGNILYQIYWNLVRKHGFIDWKNYKYGQHEDLLKQKGNTLALKVIITGMKLTLCSPTFIAARNAILQAEKALTFGNNACEIWAAFAKRGLGLSAQGLYAAPLVKSIEAYDMPKGCEIIQPWMT